jgi:hypothetical protein
VSVVADPGPVLAHYRDNAALYGRVALFDHLPMSLAALVAMGASEARIAHWARGYAARTGLRPASDEERAGRARWRAAIARGGRAHVLREHGVRLAGGFGTVAFHAAIRAAYAFAREDDDELAAALDAWERYFLPLPPSATGTQVPLRTALSALAAHPVAALDPGLIAARMERVAASGAFAKLAACVPAAEDLDGLALAAAAAFATSCGFTALHIMTASHAARMLLPHLGDPRAIMPGFWAAYAAASLVSEALPALDPAVLAELREEAPDSWEPLLEAAVANDDEHVIKSVYTAWCLDLELHDPVFRTAARRYLRVER